MRARCSKRSACTLTDLRLSGNDIGDIGATALADCLRVNATLTKLDLIGCDRVGAAGKRALRAACRPQCVLKI